MIFRGGNLRLAVPVFICLLAALIDAESANIDNCAECHGDDGMGAGAADVPVIAGIPPAHLEEALFAYQDGARVCSTEPKMCETVAGLSDTQITELSDHYGLQQRGSSSEEFDAALAETGERIHTDLCSRCHLPPDDEAADDALGIPLHGQRSAYLRYALDAYRSGKRELLLPLMAEKLAQLHDDDVEALINYYASYRSPP